MQNFVCFISSQALEQLGKVKDNDFWLSVVKWLKCEGAGYARLRIFQANELNEVQDVAKAPEGKLLEYLSGVGRAHVSKLLVQI